MADFLDVFSQSPFRVVELTTAFQRITPRPTLLGTLGTDLFRRIPSWTGQIAIGYSRDNKKLVHTSAIGSAPEQLEFVGSSMRLFRTRRLAKGSTLYPIQLQAVLAQPLFQAVQTAQAEIARRAVLIRDDLELTQEWHRYGCVLGLVLDSDGTTVLDNFFEAWGIPEPTPFNFDLTNPGADLRGTCRQVINATKDAAPDAWVQGQTVVHGLAGPGFYELMVQHEQIEKTYLNYNQAAELRGAIPDSFPFGGIVWHEWRSPQDTRWNLNPYEARFFPVGANDVFQHYTGPAEFPQFLNTMAPETVTIQFTDPYRQAYTTTEMYQYPAFICVRPEMLQRAVAAT